MESLMMMYGGMNVGTELAPTTCCVGFSSLLFPEALMRTMMETHVRRTDLPFPPTTRYGTIRYDTMHDITRETRYCSNEERSGLGVLGAYRLALALGLGLWF